MKRMLRSMRCLSSAALRLAAVLAMAAQLVLTAAPYAERARGRDASAHLEGAGVRVHHAHDEAQCPACATQHLTSRAEPRSWLAHAPAAFAAPAPAAPPTPALPDPFSASLSRAPPVA